MEANSLADAFAVIPTSVINGGGREEAEAAAVAATAAVEEDGVGVSSVYRGKSKIYTHYPSYMRESLFVRTGSDVRTRVGQMSVFRSY